MSPIPLADGFLFYPDATLLLVLGLAACWWLGPEPECGITARV